MSIILNAAAANNADLLKERLLAKINIDAVSGCWEWLGAKDSNGYGAIRGIGGTKRAHRVSFALHRGDIPNGMHVCHRCDNRACVNPEHMFLGTHAENVADRNAKGRQARLKGTTNGQAKLTETDVAAIRSAVGISQIKLAEQFGVSHTLVWRIRAGKCWTHV